MPYGEHLAHCVHCGKRWIVGDCIPLVCDECERAGHTDTPLAECPVCKQEFQDAVTKRQAARNRAMPMATKVRDYGKPPQNKAFGKERGKP